MASSTTSSSKYVEVPSPEVALASYLEEYQEFYDNTSAELVELISQGHEIEISRQRIIRMVQALQARYAIKKENEEKHKIVDQIEILLSRLNFASDRKLSIHQSINSFLDGKARKMESLFRMTDSSFNHAISQNNSIPSEHSSSANQTDRDSGIGSMGTKSSDHKNSVSNHNNNNNSSNNKPRKSHLNKNHQNHHHRSSVVAGSSGTGSGSNYHSVADEDNHRSSTPNSGSKRNMTNNKRNNSSTNHQNSNHNSNTHHNNKSSSAKEKRQSSGKTSSNNNATSLEQFEQDPNEPLYCNCQQVSYGDMICCDNDSCQIQWFHFDCVGLMSKPRGKWYCTQCRGMRPNLPKK